MRASASASIRFALTLSTLLLSPACATSAHAPRLLEPTTRADLTINPKQRPKYQIPDNQLPIVFDANVPNALLVCFGAMRRDEWRCVNLQEIRVLVLGLKWAGIGGGVAGTPEWIPAGLKH